MTLNFKYTFRDLFLFQLAHLRYKKNRWFSLGLGFIFALQALIVKILGWNANLVLINAILAVLIAFPQIMLFVISYLSHQRSKKYRRQLTLTISPKNFKIDTEHTKTTSDWQDFTNYKLYKNKLLILYRSPQHAILIPKRVVKKNDWPKLQELIAEKIQPATEPKKPFKTILKIIVLLACVALIMSELQLLLAKRQAQKADEVNQLRQQLQNLQQDQWQFEQELGMTKEEIQTAKEELEKRVVIFFKPETSEEIILELKTKLENYQLTTKIEYVSQAQAAQKFIEYNKDSNEIWDKGALDNQELANILPASLELEVTNKATVLGLLNELRTKYMIEHIQSFEL